MRFAPLLFALALPLFPQVQPMGAEAMLAFSTTEALQRWADGTNLGPAVIDVLAAEGNEVALVRRSFGSGLPACAVSVFFRAADGWQEGLRLPTLRGRWLDFEQRGDVVVLRDQADQKECLRFSISFLCEDR